MFPDLAILTFPCSREWFSQHFLKTVKRIAVNINRSCYDAPTVISVLNEIKIKKDSLFPR